jgi:hypothetical protein
MQLAYYYLDAFGFLLKLAAWSSKESMHSLFKKLGKPTSEESKRTVFDSKLKER